MVKQSRISFNVNAQHLGDEQYFLNFVKALNPASITIMHGRGLCQKILDVTEGKTVVYYREDVDRDQDILGQDPGQYIKGYRKPNGKWEPGAIQRHGWTKDIRGYLLNEPNTAMGYSWSHIVWWLASAGVALAEEGIPAVIGNLPVGAYQESDIEAGVFDPLLEMLVKTKPMLAAKGAAPHTLGVHEHTAVLDPYGVGQWPHTHLLDRTKVQRKDWPKAKDLPLDRWTMLDENGKPVLDLQGKPIRRLPPYWHILRFAWLIIRALEKTERNPNGIIQSPDEITVESTEVGPDIMGDVEAKKPNVYDVLAKTYGIPAPHISIRCYNTLQNIYHYYYPDWTFERAVFEQWKWLDEIYFSCVRAFHVFTWAYGKNDWDTRYGCNVSTYKEAHQMLLDYVGSQMPEPQPPQPPLPTDSRWVAMKALAKVSAGVNVRSKPTTTADRIGGIQYGGVLIHTIPYAQLGDLQAIAKPGGVEWYLVKLENNTIGWVHSNYLTLEAIEPTPPAEEWRQKLLAIADTLIEVGNIGLTNSNQAKEAYEKQIEMLVAIRNDLENAQ